MGQTNRQIAKDRVRENAAGVEFLRQTFGAGVEISPSLTWSEDEILARLNELEACSVEFPLASMEYEGCLSLSLGQLRDNAKWQHEQKMAERAHRADALRGNVEE